MINYEGLAREILNHFHQFKGLDVKIRVYDYKKPSKDNKLTRKDQPIAAMNSKRKPKTKGDQVTDQEYTLVLSNLSTDPRSKRYKRDALMRFGRFLQQTNVEITEKSIVTCLILHELGHLESNCLFFKNGGTMINKIALFKIVRTYLISIFGFTVLGKLVNKYGLTIDYIYNGEEMFADNFVYRNFHMVWNKVKHL